MLAYGRICLPFSEDNSLWPSPLIIVARKLFLIFFWNFDDHFFIIFQFLSVFFLISFFISILHLSSGRSIMHCACLQMSFHVRRKLFFEFFFEFFGYLKLTKFEALNLATCQKIAGFCERFIIVIELFLICRHIKSMSFHKNMSAVQLVFFIWIFHPKSSWKKRGKIKKFIIVMSAISTATVKFVGKRISQARNIKRYFLSISEEGFNSYHLCL